MTLSVKQIVSVLHQLISCEKDELFASALGNKEKMNIVASYFCKIFSRSEALIIEKKLIVPFNSFYISKH